MNVVKNYRAFVYVLVEEVSRWLNVISVVRVFILGTT